MSSLVFDIGERRRAASRFMGRVQREVQRAVAAEKKARRLTQQQIADMLETGKSVINREILGGNLTLRRLGELAWALGYEIVFEFRKLPSTSGQNQLQKGPPVTQAEALVITPTYINPPPVKKPFEREVVATSNSPSFQPQ
jgi:transcriptional regulator with XRE-family HTH domain